MIGSHFIKSKIPLLVTGFCLTILVALLYLNPPLFFQYMDHKIYDIQLHSSHHEENTQIPIVVDIDEASLEKLGQWPWPRYQISLLLEKVKAAGIAAIGVDILFAEPDRTSLGVIEQTMKKHLPDHLVEGRDIISRTLPRELLDNDRILADTLAKGRVVLGYAFDFSGRDMAVQPDQIRPLNPIVIKSDGARDIFDCLKTATGVVAPLDKLTRQNTQTGFFNTSADQDGILRATPLLMAWNGKIYPNLSLATLLEALGRPQVAVKISPGGIESLKIGPATIPLDKNGRFFVHYRGSGNQFQTISAALFLEDKIPPQSLAGKIAIVGTSAAGLKDLKATPLDPTLMGAQVHTTVIDNILKRDFITRPDWIQGLEISVLVFLGILSTLIITWARPWTTIIFTALAAVALWRLSLYGFDTRQMFMSPLFPLVILGLNFSVLSLLKFYFSEKDRVFLKKAFANYVADDLIEEIVEHPEKLKLGGQVKTATVLFCDLANFTNISENRSPYEIVDIMSRYFEEMTQFVFKHKGTLKDYIGDELMALFGAPLSEKGHAVSACRAALDMQRFLADLRANRHPDLPPLSARVGVNTGEMLVGNIGSKYRFSYGIMGDNVNLGSRLEGLNKIYGTRIIIGEKTAESAKNDFILRKLGAVKVKGKDIPQDVFELIAQAGDEIEDNILRTLESYHAGYDSYIRQDWSEAIRKFEKGLSFRPDDLACKVMIQRCQMYSKLPHMENFNGVFIERRK